MSDDEPTVIPVMLETKAAATHRLKDERRWDKFQGHRLKCVARLRAERGGAKSDVNDDAWRLALAAFPPLVVGDGCAPSSSTAERQADEPASIDAGSNPASEPGIGQISTPVSPKCPVQEGPISENSGKTPSEPQEEPWVGQLPPASASSADLSRDTLWVYQNLLIVYERDLPSPPSGGAIAMWRWARLKANRQRFFADVLPKAARGADQTEEEAASAAGDRGQVEAIGKMLDRLVEEIAAGERLFCVSCGGKLGRAV